MVLVQDDENWCRWCGIDIPREVQESEDWDGETCSVECRDNLEFMNQELNDIWDHEEDWPEEEE